MATEATPAPGEEPNVDTGQLFQLRKPALNLDEHDPDDIAISISGTVKLDRSNAEHVALFRALRLGRRVELAVDAVALKRPLVARLDKDDNVEGYTLTAQLSVEDITLADSSELEVEPEPADEPST